MTRLRNAAALPALLVALFLAAALPGRAQAPEPPAETFAEEVSLEVVNVEVHVTDRQGRPVLGLTREDFRLFEDGQEVAIEYFTAPSTPPASAPAATPSSAADPPSTGSASAPRASRARSPSWRSRRTARRRSTPTAWRRSWPRRWRTPPPSTPWASSPSTPATAGSTDSGWRSGRRTTRCATGSSTWTCPGKDRINEESFVVAVELPPGDATVVVGLRDGLGGEISYLRAELRVVGGPPPTPGGGR